MTILLPYLIYSRKPTHNSKVDKKDWEIKQVGEIMLIFIPILIIISVSFTLPIVRMVKFPESEYSGWYVVRFYASNLVAGITVILMAFIAELLLQSYGRLVLILGFFFIPVILQSEFTRHMRILEDSPTEEWLDWLYFKVVPIGFILIWWGSFLVFITYPTSIYAPLIAW